MDTGTGCIITIGVCLMLGSCVPASDSSVEWAYSEPKVKRHLPTICRPLYNDGTDAWIECMGVGYK